MSSENKRNQPHKYEVGDLVEIDDHRDEDYHGIRLYIIGCVRDCDGTPLYVLGLKNMPLWHNSSQKIYNLSAVTGISQDSIQLV